LPPAPLYGKIGYTIAVVDCLCVMWWLCPHAPDLFQRTEIFVWKFGRDYVIIKGKVILFSALFVDGVTILYFMWGAIVNTFKIDGTDFGIGEVICEIENGIIKDLTIEGDEEITESLSDDENGKWSWIAYDPPSIFFREIPFDTKNGEIKITEQLLDEYDISFYLSEHHNVFGTLTISDSYVKVSGEIRKHMSDEKLYSLEIVAER